MIRGPFLSEDDRSKLTALARDGSAVCRVTRRANALVLLDAGWSCHDVADALLFDDDTIRDWRKLYEQRVIEGLTSFDIGGSASFLSAAQEDALKAFVGATLPRSTRQFGAFIEKEFRLVYESRSGLIAHLHRLGLEYHKPEIIPRKLDEDKQKAFITAYENLLNSLADNEAVLFADARRIPLMPRSLSAVGRASKRNSRSNKRAGVNASTFTARLISKPGSPPQAIPTGCACWNL